MIGVVTVTDVVAWWQQQENEHRLKREKKQNMGVSPRFLSTYY
jgi:hypothetical protein